MSSIYFAPGSGTLFPYTQRWWSPDERHIVFTQYDLQYQPTYDTTEFNEEFLYPQKKELKFHNVSSVRNYSTQIIRSSAVVDPLGLKHEIGIPFLGVAAASYWKSWIKSPAQVSQCGCNQEFWKPQIENYFLCSSRNGHNCIHVIWKKALFYKWHQLHKSTK